MMEGRHERILVVEDDRTLGSLLRSSLEPVGYAVETKGTGCEALAEAAEHHPDLVILDLKLPDMSGYDVCRELRKMYNRWDVPILILSGMDKPIDELRGFAHGADAYLTKPYELAELLKTVSLLLGQAVVI